MHTIALLPGRFVTIDKATYKSGGIYANPRPFRYDSNQAEFYFENADWYYYTCITKNRQGEAVCSGEYIREDAVFSAIKSSLSEKLPEHIEKRRQCERQKHSLDMELRSLQAKQSIVIAKRRAEYERYVFGKVTRNEYFEAINTFPTLEQPIEQTTRETEQVNSMLSYYSSLIDAPYSRAALEAVMKNIVQEVTVSGGKVCDVVLKSVD